MKLLIITQKADAGDEIKGFFHHWIEKLSQRLDFLNVICLQSGEYSFSSNVKVWSLGKEGNSSKIKQLLRFYRYIWQLRKDYDAVFVHMNPIYVVLGGIFWKVQQKSIFLWYNHKMGGILAGLGIRLSNLVFYTSPFAFAAKFKNSKIMPVGIDTDLFKRNDNIKKAENSILSLGRISPVKKIEILIEAAKLLDEAGTEFVLNIVGGKEEGAESYFNQIRTSAKVLEDRGKVRFSGKVPNLRAPEVYNQNEVFINLTPAGSFDKTILEAMACKTLPLLFNKSLEKDLPDLLMLRELEALELKNKILRIFQMRDEEKEELAEKLRDFVIKNHNLDDLVDKAINYFHEFTQK